MDAYYQDQFHTAGIARSGLVSARFRIGVDSRKKYLQEKEADTGDDD